ncbi:hypothetical protein JEZ13_04140 [bacterium]|nr:hypothetical protein [bacterium]MBI9072950.1 hypothetical protein [Melioribacteraceae bacterium]
MKPEFGITSDAWTSGNPGIGGARVTDLKGNQLDFHNTPATELHSNNFFELLGISLAVRYALKNGIKVVYTDSQTAMAWVRNRMPGKNVKMDRDMLIARANLIADRCEKYGIEIKKWNTSEWGEIPSDYGRKSGGKKVA